MTTEPRLNVSPRENIGPLNKRPARGTKDGQLYTSPLGLSGWDAEAGLWRGASDMPTNPTYYVATTGSDTNTGTLASPLLTVQEAARRLSISGAQGQPIIEIAAGNYLWPKDTTMPQMPPGSYPILITGSPSRVLVGDKVVTGASVAPGNNPWIRMTCADLGVADGALVGTFVQFTGNDTPSLANVTIEIHKNTTALGVTTLELSSEDPTLPANGDTFGVFTTDVNIELGGGSNVMRGFDVCFQWVTFKNIPAGSSYFWTVENPFFGNALRFIDDTGGGPSTVYFSSGYIGDTANTPIPYQHRIGDFNTGCYVHGVGLSAAPAGMLSISGSHFDSGGLSAIGSGTLYNPNELIWTQHASGPYAYDPVYLTDSSSGYMFNCEFRGLTQNEMVASDFGSELTLDSITFSGCTANAGQLVLVDGSQVWMTRCDGVNGAGGLPLKLTNRSQGYRFSTANTVTGTTPGQDVKVGAHANVAWGAALTNDLASGVTSQLCLLT